MTTETTWTKRRRAIAAELQKIYERDCIITPQAVVEAARSPDSPMHKWFEWDDERAAELYRLDQARKLIREVRVEFSGSGVSAPVFVHVEDAGGYMPTEIAVSNESYLSSALRELKRQLSGVGETIAALQTMVERRETKRRIKSIASHVDQAKRAAEDIV